MKETISVQSPKLALQFMSLKLDSRNFMGFSVVQLNMKIQQTSALDRSYAHCRILFLNGKREQDKNHRHINYVNLSDKSIW